MDELNPVVNKFNTLEYLNALYSRCTEGSIVLVSGRRNTVAGCYRTTDLEKAAKHIETANTELFIKVNPLDRDKTLARNPTGIGGADDVSSIVSIHLDVDAGKDDKYGTQAEVLKALSNMPQLPSLIVRTDGDAGGFHVYWILDQPYYIRNSEDRQTVQQISIRWLQELRAHLKSINPNATVDSTGNIDRILRPVGSKRKSGRTVEAFEWHPERRYCLEDFFLPEVESDTARWEVGGRPKIIDDYVNNLGITVESLLVKHGYTPYKGSKSKWVRPGAQSGSHTGVIYTLPDGRRGFTVHSATADPLGCTNSDGKNGRWYSLSALWVALEFENDWSKAAATAHSLLEPLPPPDEWPNPEPLPQPLPDVLPYTDDLLPPVVGDVVRDIAERMQCPPDFPAAAMLVALASVIGNRVCIRPRKHDDWQVVPNLWGCVVGRPAFKKSPAIREAEDYLRAIEKRASEKNAFAANDFEVDSKLAVVELRLKQKALSSAVSNHDIENARLLAQEITDLENSVAPISRRILTTDPTIEKLADLLDVHKDGMTLWVDELLGWLRSLDRDDKVGARQQFITMWNGNTKLNIDRISRGEKVVESACLGVFGCATPGGLSDYVAGATRGGRGDDGLMQRLQVIVWPDPSDSYRRIDRKPDEVAKIQLRHVFEQLADLAADEFSEHDHKGTAFLHFAEDAQAVFDKWYDDLQVRIRAGDLPESVESHFAKYASLIPSIALVLHLAMGGRGSITLEATQMATRWAVFLESHAKRVYAVGIMPERQIAEPLLKRLMCWPSDMPIRARSIQKRGWKHCSDVKSIETALELLSEYGWVKPVASKPVTGRPTVDYVLHPEAARYFTLIYGNQSGVVGYG